MKYQTIEYIHSLLVTKIAMECKYAEDKRKAFNKACEAQQRECEMRARLGASPPLTLITPPEDEVIKCERDAEDAKDALDDFLSTDWK